MGRLAPFLSAALPAHSEKRETSVPNWHRNSSLSRASCCVLRSPSSPSGKGRTWCPWMFLNMSWIFLLPLPTRPFRNLDLFSRCFHLVENATDFSKLQCRWRGLGAVLPQAMLFNMSYLSFPHTTVAVCMYMKKGSE